MLTIFFLLKFLIELCLFRLKNVLQIIQPNSYMLKILNFKESQSQYEKELIIFCIKH